MIVSVYKHFSTTPFINIRIRYSCLKFKKTFLFFLESEALVKAIHHKGYIDGDYFCFH